MLRKGLLFFILSILFISVNLCDNGNVISIDSALNKVSSFKITKLGETIGSPKYLKPIDYSGNKYWVIPILYGGKEYYFVPVDAETGDIKYAPFVKNVILVYYLNDMLSKDNLGIKDYLTGLRGDLYKIKLCLDKKINSYNNDLNYYLEKLNYSLDDSCLEKEKETRDDIEDLINKIDNFNYTISSVDEVDILKNNLFEILDSLEMIKSEYLNTSNSCSKSYKNIVSELINSKNNRNKEILSYINAYKNIFSLNEFESYFDSLDVRIKRKDLLSLFDNLNNNVDLFYTRLVDRIKSSKIEKIKSEKRNELISLYNETINYIKSHSNFLDEDQKERYIQLYNEYIKLYNLTYKQDTSFNEYEFEKRFEKLKNEFNELKNKLKEKIKEYEKSQDTVEENNVDNTIFSNPLFVFVLLGLLGVFVYLYFKNNKKKKNDNTENLDLEDFNNIKW